MTKSPEIRPADEAEFAQVVSLLEDVGLQADGLRPAMPNLVVAVGDGRVVGCAVLEVGGRFGLIRSVGVQPAARGTGVGRRLVQAIHARAADIGLDAIYLLTTTAESYFPKFGYQKLDGEALPAVVTDSAEYSSCVAAGATVMRKVMRKEAKTDHADGA